MVFNEFNILTESKGILVNGLEENAITRVVLPHSLQTLSQQNEGMAKRCIESDTYSFQTALDFTDGGRCVDKRNQAQKPTYQKIGPPRLRTAGNAQEAEAKRTA